MEKSVENSCSCVDEAREELIKILKEVVRECKDGGKTTAKMIREYEAQNPGFKLAQSEVNRILRGKSSPTLKKLANIFAVFGYKVSIALEKVKKDDASA